ncbi:MAG: hypothetical protein M3O71_18160 [Bacteroidota bacterium]|nr:hypothetical protein [Bacteroidota bacterium]
MKVVPANTASDDPIKKLSKLQQNCYHVAVVVAFVGIFVWAAKILFF